MRTILVLLIFCLFSMAEFPSVKEIQGIWLGVMNMPSQDNKGPDEIGPVAMAITNRILYVTDYKHFMFMGLFNSMENGDFKLSGWSRDLSCQNGFRPQYNCSDCQPQPCQSGKDDQVAGKTRFALREDGVEMLQLCVAPSFAPTPSSWENCSQILNTTRPNPEVFPMGKDYANVTLVGPTKTFNMSLGFKPLSNTVVIIQNDRYATITYNHKDDIMMDAGHIKVTGDGEIKKLIANSTRGWVVEEGCKFEKNISFIGIDCRWDLVKLGNHAGMVYPKNWETADQGIIAKTVNNDEKWLGTWFGFVRDHQLPDKMVPANVTFHPKGHFWVGTGNWGFAASYSLDTTKSPAFFDCAGLDTFKMGTKEKISVSASYMIADFGSDENGDYMRIGQSKDYESKERPKSFMDTNIEVMKFYRKPLPKREVITATGLYPKSGKKGTTFDLFVVFPAKPQQRTGCPPDFQVILGEIPVQNIECSTPGVVKVTVPEKALTGPQKITLIFKGEKFPTNLVYYVMSTDVDVPPVVLGITPSRGSSNGNTNVFIMIGQTRSISSDIRVQIGDKNCTNVRTYPSKFAISCLTPSGSNGNALVSVYFSGKAINSDVYYTYADTGLKIGGIFPSFGTTTGGTTITLLIYVPDADGTVPSDLQTSVKINGEECTNSQTPTGTSDPKIFQMKCVTPQSAVSGPAVVQFSAVTGGKTFFSEAKFTYIKAGGAKANILIKRINPHKGANTGGETLTIYPSVPSNIEAKDVSVSIGKVPCKVTWYSHEKIVCETQASASGTFQVVVKYGNDFSITPTKFTYTSPQQPKINSVVPRKFQSNSYNDLKITGTFFGTSRSTVDCSQVVVSLGDSTCTNTTCTSSEIETVCPPLGSAGSDTIVVSVAGESSPSDPTVEGSGSIEAISATQPIITAIYPKSGPSSGGTSISIEGSNFGITGGDITVTLGGNVCELEELISTSKLKCRTPPGQGNPPIAPSSDLVVDVAGQSSSVNREFFYEERVSAAMAIRPAILLILVFLAFLM